MRDGHRTVRRGVETRQLGSSVEVGRYLDPEGNNFWGVETFVGDDGFTYILASDRDGGLWIFRDP